MALIDLKFEDDEQEVQPTEPGKIELQFEGQGDSDVPLAPGSTGYAAPVDQSLPENIRDWFMEGYTRTKQSIAQQKGLMLDEDYEDRSRTGARVKELERTAGKYGPDLDLMQKMQGLNEVETFGEGMSMILTDPELLGYLTVSSAGRFAPAMAATVGIGMAGGPTAAMVGTTGVGSLFIEYSATVDETMREAGMDATDPTSWMQFSQDEELQARAQERGLIRGIPIAAMDAFSMGLAGRLLAGAKPTATSVLTRSAGEVIQQSTTGALGELGAQAGEITFGHREDFSPGEIAAEAAAELGPGFAETIAGYSSQKQAAMRRQAAEQAGADAAQRVADQKLTPDFEVHSLEDNETAIDEALAAAPPTPEVRPDEESITEKFGLEQEVEQAQPELGLDSESLQAEQEANAFVLKQLRSQFPNASENELLAAIEANKPAREELPTEEDLGWVAPEEAAPAAPAAEITPKPEQPKPDTEIPSKEDLGWVAPEEIETPAFAQITPKPEQPGTAAEWGPVKEITRDEVVQATEPVESTGDAIEAAEAWRTANEEFDGLILSFKPGDERGKDKTAHYYGELAETEDADGMPIDVVLNKDYDAAAPSTPIFIVNQKDWDTGEFRQHKVMAGFDSEEEAQQGFVDMWGDKGFDSIHELNPFGFDEWRAQGDHKAPYTDLAGAEASLRDIEQYMASEEYQTELAEDEGLKDQYDSVLQERRDRVEARQPKPEQPAPEVTPAPEAGEAAPEVAAAPAPSEETEQDRKDRVQIERRERGTQAAKKARAVDTDVDDAVTFIRKLGGLNIESQSDIPAGRLKHLDTKVVGLPGIEQKGDKGLSLEKVTEQLWQEGYIADNDSRLVIDMLFEAEQKPQYTAKGSEAAAQREADAEFERQADAEAQEWADYINESTDIKEVDPETASLMKQAIELDEDATIAIAEKDTDEATFQAQLRELIDERKSQKAEKPSAPAEPAKAVEPDAGQQAPAETEGVIEAAIARWEKTPKGKAAIERQKKESAERDAAYRAQREAEFGPEWAREEHAPFEYQPLDESNPQFQALSESAKDEVRAVKSEMAEVYDNDPADRYLDALQYQLEAIVQRELAPPKEKETGISALDDAAKHHLAKIEKQMEKGRWNATQIPDVRNADGVDSVKSIALYEEALVAAGWKSIMRGKGQFWVNDKGDEIFLSSQGTLAAPIAQYKAWEARGIFDVLNDAMYADPTSVPLNKIKLTYQIGDKKVTHTAEWWVEAFEKRLTRLSELRTCA